METDGLDFLEYGVLGSGSTGNGLWIGGERGLLVDCGFSARDAMRRLSALDVDPATIAGIALTHEHGDHAGGAGRLARRLGVPVLGSAGTLAGLSDRDGFERVPLDPGRWTRFAGFGIRAFDVPHDSAQPVGLRVRHRGRDVGILTDCGGWDDAIASELSDADVLYVESNHDVDLLANGPYPEPLKRRIRGGQGHLSNDACGALLARAIGDRTRRVLLGHLSRQNNTPALALATNHGLLSRAGVRAPKLVATLPYDPLGPWKVL